MRLDKFLKVSRIIKRRTVAKEFTDNGRALVNDRVAKSSTNVEVGDTIELHFGERTMKVRVLNTKETTKKNESADLYEEIN
ncbi:RNA-binding S4 domain-containing protein [Companilactobacillus sp.]|jgi:ribosomal 50S subunit-recycling heat shock protein|uniref:RNA-binding S4 domain-containing protein n=1 Tax=Companilactobacillus sp. TaxID=2767905 RepID=UPI0025BB29A7|nr:RNA-binding S4 domain-containing protein [Companilactobacillus sp.]MCH4010153.1 RNA-binding S4 domain-containing protein [Companilactobacillus sp.]MCH4052171.1 RNA-binding S4 domain-containing protein [Companilactobacillus sp.]MCH4078095.1 RNA-binding S4 domain-containing protein [Companilactobacillus sp.]MCH4126671.1 RNA-binding S4 domain-containing protein [Companilactobacillus sp.]MCH4132256.1 RNA-binding S4 domain-containing protein [Companilactobacillus sp.]